MWKMAATAVLVAAAAAVLPTKVVLVAKEMSALSAPEPVEVLALPVILALAELAAVRLVAPQPRHHTDSQTGE
jgi:hypothetical protein